VYQWACRSRKPLTREGGACKPACKPGSVPAASFTARRPPLPGGGGRPSIYDAGCPAPPAARPGTWGEQPLTANRPSLFGLAPGGVYLAGRSPDRRWALTPPFHRCRGWAAAVSFLWHSPSGRPDWALPSALLCGARTFLGRRAPAAVRPACPPILSPGRCGRPAPQLPTACVVRLFPIFIRWVARSRRAHLFALTRRVETATVRPVSGAQW
jgi:hypothetical protein